MRINKCVKAKYVRESKMSVASKEKIEKAYEEKKKMDKKLNMLVKKELDNKVIPDKKLKD